LGLIALHRTGEHGFGSQRSLHWLEGISKVFSRPRCGSPASRLFARGPLRLAKEFTGTPLALQQGTNLS